jgi:hypothetical protein
MNDNPALTLLKNRVNQMDQKPSEITRADVDELLMITEVCRDILPNRFVEVVADFDKRFMQGTAEKVAFAERISRILSVAEKLPSIDNQQQSTDELLPSFSLTEKDKFRVLDLCQELRKIIFASELFDEPHKRRLLNRVAAIELQVHQKKGLFDIVRGGINDLGETFGKFGRDIEPLTKRMEEVVKITRRATNEYDQLPAPDEIKQLPPPQ